jgi:hypothetical protein
VKVVVFNAALFKVLISSDVIHCMYVCVCVYIYIHTHTHMYIYIHTYMCVCVYIYIYMNWCVCVYTHMHNLYSVISLKFEIFNISLSDL